MGLGFFEDDETFWNEIMVMDVQHCEYIKKINCIL